MNTSGLVTPLYKTVVDDVINNIKEVFLDEGVDEQVLQELKQLWEGKLAASKALEPMVERPEVQMPNPAMSILLQQPHGHVQAQIQQGYISRGAVLTTTSQPVQQQTFPMSISTSQGELTGAAAAATMALPMGLFQQQLAALGAGQGGNITLQAAGNGQFIAVQNINGRQTAIAIPQQFVQNQGTLQAQHVAGVNQVQQVQQVQQGQGGIIQLDGNGDTSSSEDEDFDNDDNDDENDEDQNDDDAEQGEEEEPLNSADDVSEEDPTELFDAENVVVCQYDKINRNKNKWKFHLKDGIMNLNGKDYVFQKANGDAEW